MRADTEHTFLRYSSSRLRNHLLNIRRGLKRRHGYCDVASKGAAARIESGVRRVVLEERPRVELHAATGQPATQHRFPYAANLICSAAKRRNRILASGNCRS